MTSLRTVVTAISLFSMIMSGLMNAAPQLTHVGIPDSQVTMLTGGSPEFMETLASFADKAAISALQPLLPYCVLVKNGSASRLMSILVRYELTDGRRPVVTHHFMLGTIRNEPRDMIPPGAVVLITPITSLNIQLGPGRSSIGLQHVGELTYFISSTVDLYSRQAAISVSLDSIVFDDGTLIGPDKTRNLDRINEWVRAEKDVAAALATRRGPDVVSYLSGLLQVPVKDAKSYAEVDHFQDHRRSFVTGLLQRFEAHKSVDSLLAEINGRVESLTPPLNRRNIR